MNQKTAPAKAAPAKSKRLIGYDVSVEGTYWGSGAGGHAMEKAYSITVLVPANYNLGGRGNTYVKKALLGKITGSPLLKTFKDSKGNQPFADYRQLRTHNIVDWAEVFDEERAEDMVKEKAPAEMSADELKRALTKLGITYPNPARKIELINLLEKAQGKAATEEEDDGRPNFGDGAKTVPTNPDDIETGVAYINDDGMDPATGLPPEVAGKDTFTT